MPAKKERQVVLIIHNVRSAHNVGSMFRTADGAGVSRIYLTGYTPLPPEENKLFYTPAEKAFLKTALGAEKTVAWKKFRLFRTAKSRLKALGFEIVALEQTEESRNYRDFQPGEKTALVVGNEVRGMDARILRQCDAVMEIPMRGEKNSLNVSVAAGIALYHITSTMK